MLTKIKMILREIIDFGLLLIAIAIILEVLFGPSSPFLGQNIIGNLVNLVKDLGDAGVVGLISIAIIIYLWNRLKKD
jgi:hypothetical protein|tara:strand:- start:9127 stop:9357 length:231 start_codon:yes stop_codon:yes gene_type:complete